MTESKAELLDPVRHLNRIYDQVAQGKYDQATAYLYDLFDRWLGGEHYDSCSAFLEFAHAGLLGTRICRSALSLTLKDKDKLPSRDEFHRKAYEYISAKHGDGQADRLLKHLQ
jgi:hypothetical protein